MPIPLLKLTALALVAALILPPQAHSQDGVDRDTVLATVNGVDITLGHVVVLRAGLPAQYAEIPAKTLFDGILNQLIQQTLLSQSLEGAPSKQVQLMIENETRALTASDAIGSFLDGAITEDALRAAYDAEFMKSDPTLEYSAAHILVQTEEEANDLLVKLDEGADFSALAQEFSTGPSGPSGGDLGWFSEGVMVAPFFEAVSKLSPGEVSAPVNTDFGWHLILLRETRTKDRPEFEDVRTELEDILRDQALDAHLAELEANGTVERSETSGIDPAVVNDPSILEQ